MKFRDKYLVFMHSLDGNNIFDFLLLLSMTILYGLFWIFAIITLPLWSVPYTVYRYKKFVKENCND